MTRNEYMNTLSEALAPLSPAERRDILNDYREHFALGAEGGKTEAEIAAALGDPF